MAEERSGGAALGLGAAFRVPEFRAVWAAEAVSVAGDQLARVALTVLVYTRTGSAAWAAFTYALTFLPALLGGILLGRLADRHPRREVMVVCDVARAGLVAVMALPGLPLPALCALLVLVVLLAPPHASAQGALLPEVLPGSSLEAGLAVRQITAQAAQVAGFAGGGLLVALIGTSGALGLNAATFAVSAVVLRIGLTARPAPAPDSAGSDDRTEPSRQGPGWCSEVRAGLVAVFANRRRRTFALAAWLVGCYVLPEALAVPYAAQLGEGAAVAGLLMAADPAGSAIGAWLWIRFMPLRTRERGIGPLAVLAGLPLAACAFAPGVGVSILLWALTGAAATACLVQAQAEFVRATPIELRGRAIGVAASGLITAQGVAVLLGGLLADSWDARGAIVVCGVLGMAAAAALTLTHHRLRVREASDSARAAT